MNESIAAALPQARAAEVARVLELQSEWENLAADREHSTTRLQAVQKAFDTYRNSMLAYAGRENGQTVAELSLNKSTRLRTWCRTVRAILLRAEGTAVPIQMMAKAHRVVGRLASRCRIPAPATEGAADLAGAIRQLDGVIAWCEEVEAAPLPAAAAYEVGGGDRPPSPA